MDLSVFQRLGERVDDAYRGTNYDELRLPEIASQALSDTELPDFDFEIVGDFLKYTGIPQEPGLAFSDLPVVVHYQPEFFIQLLIWNTSTTAIHQHGFSGAFAVLSGSSIHTRYRFEEQRRINSLLLQGQAHFQHIELLRKGDVREIFPGSVGPFHALFHLDQPSVTVVIRNSTVPEAHPQWSIARPHFAFGVHELEADSRISMLRRWLRTMLEAEDAAVKRVALEQIPLLDFPRIFMFRRDIDRLLPDPEDREQLIANVRERHGDLADHLADVMRLTRTEKGLIEARNHTYNSELRFFLALLLNAPTRSAIYSMARQFYPGEPPEARCAAWLAKLGNPKTVIDEMVRRGTKQRDPTMVERLTVALPCSGDSAVDLIQTLLRGAGDATTTDPGDRHPSDDKQGRRNELSKAREQLRALPELAPLFVE